MQIAPSDRRLLTNTLQRPDVPADNAARALQEYLANLVFVGSSRMALTSAEYEARANRLRSQMGETVDELRSNLAPSKLASEAASRVGVSELSWRGALDFASTRHPGPTAIAVALWFLAAARKRNKEGVHEVTVPLRESSSSLVDTANARVSRASGDQAA
jgi:hypothetical protein